MAFKRFQNTVTESKFFLPLAVAISAGACYLSGLVTNALWMQLVCLLVSAILILELNSSHQLLRVQSQATPAMFLLLTSAAIFIFPNLESCIVQLCAVAVYFMLFHCDLHHPSPGWTFYGFFCLGLASMVFVQILYFVPVLWVLMAFCLRAFTARTFFASLLGLLTPYWLVMPIFLYISTPEAAISHFSELASFQAFGDYSIIDEHEWLTFGWLCLLSLISIIHYANQGYQDKIRTRLLHEVFITIDMLAIFFYVLQPQHHHLLMGIIIVNTSPLIAHYLTLTHTWLTNISFHLIILITLAIIFYNVWMPSSNFLSAMATQACLYLPL